jgi:hypothetical protein
MNDNTKYIIIGIVILLLSFFVGRWTSPKEIKNIKVTVPASSGTSPIIIKPKPLIQIKDSLIYKDTLIVTENPFNKELADKYISLESETARLKEYINSIQIRKYQIPFENDTIKIVGDVEVQGTLNSLKYNWTIKERKLDVPVKINKSTFKVLVGGGISNTKELDKFNFTGNAGIQTTNGNVILGGYSFDQSISLTYLIKL